MNESNPFRRLPSVDAVLSHPEVRRLPRDLAKQVTVERIEELREDLRLGLRLESVDVPGDVLKTVRSILRPHLLPVINATGVVIHTNLGRAPWAAEALESAFRVASGYANVEYDLGDGVRGERLTGVQELLRRLTGCEAAVVVNNCAAAVLLAVSALADKREVVVSRGELVEIGGSFRVPEIIETGGATLVEVGTTNRTRLSDYDRAINENTGVLLHVHPANFRMQGFTESVRPGALAALGWERGIQTVADLGSGALDAVHGEPSVREAVQEGVAVVTFSGDKLLGGPQAGICVGQADAIEALRRHPLYRAMRLDKVSVAALAATLRLHLEGRDTPVARMLDLDEDTLARRGISLCARLRDEGVVAHCRPGDGYVGGGAMPMHALPSTLVTVAVPSPAAAQRRLRSGSRPVVCRVALGQLLFDLRTVQIAEESALLQRIVDVAGEQRSANARTPTDVDGQARPQS